MGVQNVPVRWPTGPTPWLICLTYFPLLMITFWPAAREFVILDKLWALSINLFKTEDGVIRLTMAAMGAHTLESLYAAKLCRKAGLGHEQLMGWVSLTLLLGYAAIHSLKKMIAAAKKEAADAAASAEAKKAN